MRALAALNASPRERLLPRDPAAPRDPDAARPARRSAVERLAADRAKYVRGRPGTGRGVASEGSGPGAIKCPGNDPGPPARAPVPVARRVIARKPLRPDSLIIYRQKCEFVRGAGADGPRASLVKKLFQGPGKDKAPVPRTGDEGKTRNPETVPTKPGAAADLAPPETPAPAARSAAPSGVPAAPPGPEPRVVRRRGLQRSQSDLSSRYSAALAESDTFFQYCGLDPEVVEALGRENFTAGSDHVTLKVRSVSVATSGSGFSRHSGGNDDGLQEEELIEQVPSTTSVIERNARIIKWLYTCKKATETPSQEQSRSRGVCSEGWGGAGRVRGWESWKQTFPVMKTF
ncbi:PREDICTED: protein FAM110C isoform X1 [Rhinopithecus bieti]|uniref:protein FAM110C isoform X1 n=1 Tax=Rhinopithecus bieti TaxID=61621 RepID=UPI00083C1092|nr:PREDICTED: protein FAM110C isoform X1 [Rhinopithecus bieti]